MNGLLFRSCFRRRLTQPSARTEHRSTATRPRSDKFGNGQAFQSGRAYQQLSQYFLLNRTARNVGNGVPHKDAFSVCDGSQAPNQREQIKARLIGQYFGRARNDGQARLLVRRSSGRLALHDSSAANTTGTGSSGKESIRASTTRISDSFCAP